MESKVIEKSYIDHDGLEHRVIVFFEATLYHLWFYYANVELVSNRFSTPSKSDALATAEVYIDAKRFKFGDFVVDRVIH